MQRFFYAAKTMRQISLHNHSWYFAFVFNMQKSISICFSNIYKISFLMTWHVIITSSKGWWFFAGCIRSWTYIKNKPSQSLLINYTTIKGHCVIYWVESWSLGVEPLEWWWSSVLEWSEVKFRVLCCLSFFSIELMVYTNTKNWWDLNPIAR